jgi:hypothetical protein
MNKRQEMLQKLRKDGIVVEELDSWPAKATYYKSSGEALPNLPADPYSMAKYLRRGFTLTPPAKPSGDEKEGI